MFNVRMLYVPNRVRFRKLNVVAVECDLELFVIVSFAYMLGDSGFGLLARESISPISW